MPLRLRSSFFSSLMWTVTTMVMAMSTTTTAEEVGCGAYQDQIEFAPGITFDYTVAEDDGETILRGRMSYEHASGMGGYVSIGFPQEGGGMIGAKSIIGLLDEPVQMWDLNSYLVDGVVPSSDSDIQNLIREGSFVQSDESSVLEFAVALDDGALNLFADGETASSLIWAVGSSNSLSYHSARGASSVTFDVCQDSAATEPEEVDCRSFQEQIEFSTGVTLDYTVVEEDDDLVMKGRMTYQHAAGSGGYVSIGFPEEGSGMIGAKAIIGLLDEPVQMWNLNSYDVSGVVPSPGERTQSLLREGSFMQSDEESVLEFSLGLGDGRFNLVADGETESSLIWAVGGSNGLGYHPSRGLSTVTLDVCKGTVATTNPPTVPPTAAPSMLPTTQSPTASPSMLPTTQSPTVAPSMLPTTASPTTLPTVVPTAPPTVSPTDEPSPIPSSGPSAAPVQDPTFEPTKSSMQPPPPTSAPVSNPTSAPVANPTSTPTMATPPKKATFPTLSPTPFPTVTAPTSVPSSVPSTLPSTLPSEYLSDSPSSVPSSLPSTEFEIPLSVSSEPYSNAPSDLPSSLPSTYLSEIPSGLPSEIPSEPPAGLRNFMGDDDILSNYPSMIPSSFPSILSSSEIPSEIPSQPPAGLRNFGGGDDMFSDNPSMVPSSIPTMLFSSESPSATGSNSDSPSSVPTMFASSSFPTASSSPSVLFTGTESPGPSSECVEDDPDQVVRIWILVRGQEETCAWLARQPDDVKKFHCEKFGRVERGCQRTCDTCLDRDEFCADEFLAFRTYAPTPHTCAWLAARRLDDRKSRLCKRSAEALEFCSTTCNEDCSTK